MYGTQEITVEYPTAPAAKSGVVHLHDHIASVLDRGNGPVLEHDLTWAMKDDGAHGVLHRDDADADEDEYEWIDVVTIYLGPNAC